MTTQVTAHAVERFIERIDPNEPYPRGRIREEFHEAIPIDGRNDRFRDETCRNPESGAVYVFSRDRKETTVITCFLAADVLSGNYDAQARSALA